MLMNPCFQIYIVNNLELASRGFVMEEERTFCIINLLVSEDF
jgi:hypothetical protein